MQHQTVHAAAVVAILFLIASLRASAQPAPFPLKPGMAAVTCGANLSDSAPHFVLGVIDTRNPPLAKLGVNWEAPMYHGPGDSWTLANLGEVFGICLDADGNIYTTATSCYPNNLYGPGGPGGIYRIDGRTGAISVFARLPNSTIAHAPALGNICYDPLHSQLLATNFEDGRIYRLARNGTLLETFDPMRPDDGTPGFAPLGERPWGIGVFGTTVYYGVWCNDMGRRNGNATPNVIRAVDLNASGAFVPASDRLEITLPHISAQYRFSSPVASINFSAEGKMLVAERSMAGDDSPSAHASRVLEYGGTPGNWGAPTVILIGFYNNGFGSNTNCAGGADYEYGGYNPGTGTVLGCDSTIWATGDALRYPHNNPDGGRGMVYGMTRVPAAGNTAATLPATSYFVDFDMDTLTSMKTQIGAVAILRPCFLSDTSAICAGDSVQLTPPPAATYRWDPTPGLSCYDCNAPMASPGATTTYRVSMTTSAGVSLRDSFVVLVLPTGTVHISAGPERQESSESMVVPIVLGESVVTEKIDHFSIVLDYDPACLTPANIAPSLLPTLTAGTLTSGWQVTATNTLPGHMELAFTAPPTAIYLGGPGTLATLRFTPYLTGDDRSWLRLGVTMPTNPCRELDARGDTVVYAVCGGRYRMIELLPASSTLDQNHPNPFNPTTVIPFSLASAGHARLEIYNELGKLVAVPLDADLPAARHQVEWDASAFPSGVYTCRLQTGSWSAERRMVLRK
ncbi:MAG TPA: T9SS type A sorting domain-containing protein [Candidatus Kapabacteria bacterium]|nr:T9SS type A sorting domain-containing protein [Candidatus Kapabacteria bacterium]